MITGQFDTAPKPRDCMRRRFDKMTEEGKKETDEHPMYVLVDEMGALMNDKKHRNMYAEIFADIAMFGRAAHVILILCTQNPTRRALPDRLRDNMVNRVMLRQEDQSRYQYVLGRGANDLGPLPRIGQAWIKTPDMGNPQRVSTNADDDTLWNLLND